MAPKYCECKIFDTSIEVGPSAAPIIPIEAASLISNPNTTATTIVAKIPNCAAAPNKNIFGLDNSGPKSIIAPIPINNRIGRASEALMPTSNNHSIIPVAFSANPGSS